MRQKIKPGQHTEKQLSIFVSKQQHFLREDYRELTAVMNNKLQCYMVNC